MLNIAHCLVQHNGADGIHCDSSDPNIAYCTASYNQHGIYCEYSGPLITNCLLEHNGHGIRCDQADPNILRSILRDNGFPAITGDDDENGYNGNIFLIQKGS